MSAKYHDCEACGNVLVPGNVRYCSECYQAIKAKEESSNVGLQKRLDRLERRIKELESEQNKKGQKGTRP